MGDTALLQMEVPLPGALMITRHSLQAVSSPSGSVRMLSFFGFMVFIFVKVHFLEITSSLYHIQAATGDNTPQ
jgi:hypothetical protein